MHCPNIIASENHRFLMTEDGQPFFWLGDTAWELFHRLTRPEIDLYLETRAEQGFNVVQAVCLAEEDGLTVPNREGFLPLVNLDPETPDLTEGGYWDLVDYAVSKAESLGIYIAMLPTWGDKINQKWGRGPVVFNVVNAYVYGQFIGSRYGHFSNIIWVVGGDRPTEDKAEIFDAMARGIRDSEPERRLMTFHPPGPSSSSAYFHDAPWLDLNMTQSGHGWFDVRGDVMIDEDYARTPVKPVLDGEPCYENHRPFRAMMDMKDLSIPAFQARDVRRVIYSGVFAGGCGVTYGCHAMWQFGSAQYKPVNHPIGTWQQSLGLPGAKQVHILKDLLLSLPYFERVPDQSILEEGQGEGWEIARATRDSEGKFALIYVPMPRPIKVKAEVLEGLGQHEWLDPRTGQKSPAQLVEGYFAPPTAEDWVLELTA